MKRNDIIFAIVCGLSVAWIAVDFLGKIGLIFVIVLPVLSVLGLLLCLPAGRQATDKWQKPIFIGQAAKFALAGAFADVVDIKVYQFLFLLLPFPLFLKAISFFIATVIKYWTNKHWSFEKHEGGEMVQFFIVAIVGLLINVVSFYCACLPAGRRLGAELGISAVLWTESSIIFAALVAAAWNFLGYKFIVFKK